MNDKDIWYMYVVLCRDGTLYTGITKDMEKRVLAHNTALKGARYTRSRRPVTLVYSEKFPSRSAAASREYQLKQMPTAAKRRLVEEGKAQENIE
ncbi:MAG: hypothetical protein A2521_17255 [Deltaproteobacteria bacterium RIFOXYD12_FULL_57_12]|nr:MAG: hypothetical protein A2521_17255 [Deltaproteobacteria bacterium RIFOXYD12_FULL_57_12]